MRARHRRTVASQRGLGLFARRGWRALVAGSVVMTCALSSSTALADVVGDAKSNAANLRQRVNALRLRAEVSAEAYNRAQVDVADTVSAYLTGDQALQAAQQQADIDRDLAAGRIVALYETGGPLAIYSGAMTGGSLTDAYDSVQMARTVVSGDAAVVARGTASLQAVSDIQDRLSTLRDKQAGLEKLAAQRADQARAANDAAEALLASADETVRRLVAEQEAAAAAAAAADFARRVAAADAAAAAARAGAAALAGLPTNTTGSPGAVVAIAAARTRLGLPYVWGATGPSSFDCSGLTQWAYAYAGIHLPRVAADQYNFGRRVAITELAPGDLVYWATDITNPASIHHVAIYLGNGQILAAPHTGAFVREEAMFGEGYIGATRPTG